MFRPWDPDTAPMTGGGVVRGGCVVRGGRVCGEGSEAALALKQSSGLHTRTSRISAMRALKGSGLNLCEAWGQRQWVYCGRIGGCIRLLGCIGRLLGWFCNRVFEWTNRSRPLKCFTLASASWKTELPNGPPTGKRGQQRGPGMESKRRTRHVAQADMHELHIDLRKRQTESPWPLGLRPRGSTCNLGEIARKASSVRICRAVSLLLVNDRWLLFVLCISSHRQKLQITTWVGREFTFGCARTLRA